MSYDLDYESLIYKGINSMKKTFDAQRDAVEHLGQQYKTDEFSQINVIKSLDLLLSTSVKGGKVVMCGVGKSHKIACKLTATLNSLSIPSVTLHPTEALHGDLGILNDRDIIIMLTASGNTPELINLLPHISSNIPIVLLTCNKESSLAKNSRIKSLLYTELPGHLKEEVIHGLPAPTVSATLALIMADAVILALAELLEQDPLIRKKTFSMKHPGGSIGANLSHLNDNVKQESTSEKTQYSSYSSFLSLDQLKSSINSALSDSSSDEETTDGIEIQLKNELKAADAKDIEEWDTNKIASLDETTFLKTITLRRYVVLNSKDTNYGVRTLDLKAKYVESQDTGVAWQDFSENLLSIFLPVDQ